MEKLFWSAPEKSQYSYEVVEVITGLKQVSLIIKIYNYQEEMLALYRPESTIKVSIDPSIPKPLELYLDCAFSQQCQLLGWSQFLPVIPWSLDETDKGVVRPYWRDVKTLNIYNFNKSTLLATEPTFWKTIAIADYVFGIGDRVSNDFLLTDDGIKIADNGFSFLSGIDLPTNLSIIREKLAGVSIASDQDILTALSTILSNISNQDYLSDENKYWVIQRVKNTLSQRVII